MLAVELRTGNFNHCLRVPSDLEILVWVEIILSRTSAVQSNLSRWYPLTRKLKKNSFYKNFFVKYIKFCKYLYNFSYNFFNFNII